MAFRAFWSILKLAAGSLLIIAAWAAVNVDSLQRLDERYRQRNAYRERLREARAQIERLKAEREELARGGFPAEKALRELYLFGRPGEKALLLDETPGRPALKPQS
jgi:cell division protein FtsB